MKRIIVKPYFLPVLFSLLLLSFSGCSGASPVEAKALRGVIHLDDSHIKQSVQLDGMWEFYWKKHLTPDDFISGNPVPDAYVRVPGKWRDFTIDGTQIPWDGYATYRLRVNMPSQRYTNLALRVGSIGTAYEIWIDTDKSGGCGRLGYSRSEMVPSVNNVIYSVPPVEGPFDIIINVSNYYEMDAGIWYNIILGEVTELSRSMNYEFAFDLFMCGILLIMGIYHLILFMYRRKERSSLMFGIYSIIFSLRVAVVNTRLLHSVTGMSAWELLYKAEFFTFYAGVPVFVMLIYFMYRQLVNRFILKSIVILSALATIVMLVLPTEYVVYTLTPFQVFTLLVGLFVIYVLVRAAKRKYEGSYIFLAGIIILFSTIVIDIVHSQMGTDIKHISPMGLTLVLILQSIIMAKRFANSYNKVEILTEDLFSTNVAYSRFVPHEFLDLLKIKSINSVKIGSNIERDMTVLFADIRNFTEMSETMTTQENFNFLNSFYGKISPAIRKNGGFIDKYIGDGFMALFPKRSEDAVNAAVSILNALKNYNEERNRAGYRPIEMGIGIHSGSIILGTIGDEQRMDGTVISDTVNLASRLENLTKIGSPIIISHTSLYQIENISDYHFRFIGEMYVKGKQKLVSVFEIYDGLSEEIIRLKDMTKRDFEAGITFLSKKDYKEARIRFEAVIRKIPQDRVARFYYDRIKYKISIPFRFHESMLELDKEVSY